MTNRKEGVRRLSIAAGIITPFIVFFGIAVTNGELKIPAVVIFSLLCGGAAFGLVRLIAWVIAGFTTK